MNPEDESRPHSYVAYIDEAGDDGLRTVRPIASNGASEWLILSAVVIDAKREEEVLPWVRAVRASINHKQSPDLHFQRLGDDERRLAVCEQVAALPLRCFAVISNKKNMAGYVNKKAERVPSRNWFYCWMGRLLLERVTVFCARKNAERRRTGGKVKLEFSERGGMAYGQLRAYLQWIKMQSRGSTLYLDRGDLDWSVVDTDLVESHKHKLRAGLQLADVVASALYQAVNIKPNGSCVTGYAKALGPRMARGSNGLIADFGVKAMPSPPWKAKLLEPQKEIFAFYGYTPEQIGR